MYKSAPLLSLPAETSSLPIFSILVHDSYILSVAQAIILRVILDSFLSLSPNISQQHIQNTSTVQPLLNTRQLPFWSSPIISHCTIVATRRSSSKTSNSRNVIDQGPICCAPKSTPSPPTGCTLPVPECIQETKAGPFLGDMGGPNSLDGCSFNCMVIQVLLFKSLSLSLSLRVTLASQSRSLMALPNLPAAASLVILTGAFPLIKPLHE